MQCACSSATAVLRILLSPRFYAALRTINFPSIIGATQSRQSLEIKHLP
jgi:hypothetical protein